MRYGFDRIPLKIIFAGIHSYLIVEGFFVCPDLVQAGQI
jgi:hypothetical protein